MGKLCAAEEANVEPEHMRFIYKDRQLKDCEGLDFYDAEDEAPVRILFTAGHEAMCGGVQTKTPAGQNPFNIPKRGISGSKGARASRMSGRLGGMGLIRKYGILMKRQEFREKAPEIGFVKYR